MLRITTGAILTNYKSQLMRSSNNLYKAQNTVLTQRKFNSYAEDPAAATQAFKLRRNYSRTSDQLTNTNSLINKFGSAWSAVGTVKNLVEDSADAIALRAINDPTASGRQALGTALKNNAESIVQTLNIKYGDAFIFAGNDGLNVPFSWSDTGELLFRGISVNAGTAGMPDGTPPHPNEATGDWAAYYTDPLNPTNAEFAKLVKMDYEATYIDVGAGLSENADGSINTASAFNSAISGLSFLGYGLDDEGDPLNVVSLMMNLSDIFSRCNPDSGAYAEGTTDKEDAARLTKKLEDALNDVTTQWVALDGKSAYLETTRTRLTEYADTVNEQILSIEQTNLADAITEFSWAQYCYNAALKSGESILSNSLFDYMG